MLLDFRQREYLSLIHQHTRALKLLFQYTQKQRHACKLVYVNVYVLEYLETICHYDICDKRLIRYTYQSECGYGVCVSVAASLGMGINSDDE
jgi:hypothetical protein